ncbi:MAG: hypothetical protein HY842_14490 [Bacteroidetes bacterium]|nr:hypothetical protein [Bacteroidota bacterium]
MAKPKLKDLKTYFDSLDEAGVREELLKLFGKLPQVQEFYAQELLSDSERKAMLEDYKAKIYKQFWTKSGNPRSASNAEIRTLINNFEKVSIFPSEVIDLLLYRVETATEMANQFGGMPDADYNASYNAFKKAMELIAEHKLGDMFRERCKEIFRYDNLDYWYIEWLQDSYKEYIKS